MIHTFTEGTMRDMTKAAYEKKLQRYGFGGRGPMGYRRLPAPHDNCSVSEWNGGETYRGRLAYLLDALSREEKREAERQQLADNGCCTRLAKDSHRIYCGEKLPCSNHPAKA